jgi:hypothetical protein
VYSSNTDGAKGMVLEGAQKLLKRWTPILLISVNGFTPTHPVLMMLKEMDY